MPAIATLRIVAHDAGHQKRRAAQESEQRKCAQRRHQHNPTALSMSIMNSGWR